VKTRLFAALLATIAGCGGKPAPAPTTPDPTPEATPEATTNPAPAAPTPDPGKPKPEYGTYGFDAAGMDKAVPPGESFYQYADGTWLKTTQMPADKSNYGLFGVLEDRSRERVKAIAEASSGAPGTDAQRIGDYYKTFMDEAAIEALGTAPIKANLDAIAKIKDPSGLMLAFATASRQRGSGNPFRTVIGQDDREPDKYIPNMSQGGLGLPDRDMYEAKNKQFEKLRDGYKKYIVQVFTLAGLKDADKRAAAVYALEEKIAQTHWTRVQNRDPQKTYNKLTIADLAKLAPGVDWKPWLKAVGLAGQPAVLVGQPPAIAGEAKLVKSEPLAAWKDYLTLHTITDAAPFLPRAFVDAHFEMYGKTLSGTPEIEARWKRAVGFLDRQIGEAIGQLYVAKYFTPETKAHADQLVKNLLVSMGQRLDGLTWMSAETKAKAKEKLATYNPKIGYPTKWRDYAALKIVAGDAVGNARRAAEFEYDRRLARIGQPVDRDEWRMTPMTVNASYEPVLNEITFPAAILQPPFFDPNADDAVNYGGIGAVIGHEVSHGFDDEGAQYDAHGTLKNWWTKDDTDKFKTATAKLVAQYDAYCPIPAADGKPAQCVKGQLTLGENIADLAGITIAYNAYKLSLGGKPAPTLDGTTGDQRFFFGWAQVWRRLYRPQELANRLVTDPHAPSEFRADVVRNIDVWYDAFKPKETDALYLAPDKRVKIW
jgi:putative endopeptidase